MTTTLTTRPKCPECGGSHIVRDETIGEFVCDKCGLVINGRIFDRGPEWRAFTPEEKQAKRRVGAPNNYSLYDKGLSTTIQINRDAYGPSFPQKSGVRCGASESGRYALVCMELPDETSYMP